MAVPAVRVRGLTKFFEVQAPVHRRLVLPFVRGKQKCALLEVGFSVDCGQILGVVGPNGAGKTTLLRILANLLKADQGMVELCGQRSDGDDCHIRHMVGYVSSDERSFFWRLTGRQNLVFFSRLYEVPRAQAGARSEEMVKLFGVADEAENLFRDYSTGTRKKFALIRALIHEPKILLLDEVTNSLDPASARDVRSLVRRYVSARKGRAAIWSTHRLEEVPAICDTVLAIEKGRVKFFGAVCDLECSNGGIGDVASGRGGVSNTVTDSTKTECHDGACKLSAIAECTFTGNRND